MKVIYGLVLFLMVLPSLYGCVSPVHRADGIALPPAAVLNHPVEPEPQITQREEAPPLPLITAPPISPSVEEKSFSGIQGKIEDKLNRELLVLPVLRGAALLRGVDELKSFYAARTWQPAWFDGEAPSATVSAFLKALGKAEEEGLSSREYHHDEINGLLNSWMSLASDAKTDAQADLDILLTDAYRAYAAHLYGGKIEPGRVSDQWPVQKTYDPKIPELEEIPTSDRLEKTLLSLSPAYLGYRQVRDLLARYRRIEAAGGWPVIPGGKLVLGQRNARVAVLKKRLYLSGELSALPAKNRDLYDASLEKAVKLFQRAHNQKEDGVAGPATLRLLNIPVAERIDQIRLNMERWRWMPRNMDRYIFVNIPSFELKVAEKGLVVLKMRTIVGMEEKPTPSFANRVTHIEINPVWNIPRSIIEKEIIPKVKKDPAYLSRQGIRIYRDWRPDAKEISPKDLDWKTINPRKFPYRLVQDPGPLNPLGQIKFLFPNVYDVYMHDTPSRHLFTREGRTFSHGCIRLEKPLDLAEYLLRAEPGWTRSQIVKKIESKQRLVITLRDTIPVHIVYFTVWIGDGGLAYFRDDLYEYDRQLDTAIHRSGGKKGGFLF
jgi:murein L,D-transpeptidase YcbB/YkuD